MSGKRLICPKCHKGELMLKYEVKFVYSYVIDSDAPGLKNTDEFLPFLYDNREQKEANQYIECDICGMRKPFIFSHSSNQISAKALEEVINSLGNEPV